MVLRVVDVTLTHETLLYYVVWCWVFKHKTAVTYVVRAGLSAGQGGMNQ